MSLRALLFACALSFAACHSSPKSDPAPTGAAASCLPKGSACAGMGQPCCPGLTCAPLAPPGVCWAPPDLGN